MIDIGANLTHRRFQRDLPQVLRRARDAHLQAIIITGTSLRESRNAIQLVRRLRANPPPGLDGLRLFTTVGVHPHDAKEFQRNPQLFVELKQLIERNRDVVVAVGECGLDFNRDFSPRDVQQQVFQQHLEMAWQLQMPLFVHERDAFQTFVAMTEPLVRAARLPPLVVHCFTGKPHECRKYLELGLFIGVTGYVCMHSRGLELRNFVEMIPPHRLMVETDAPFMHPQGYKGNARCEPKDLQEVVNTLAACMRVTPEELARQTTSNTRSFFKLDEVALMASSNSRQIPTKPLVTAAGGASSSPPPPAPTSVPSQSKPHVEKEHSKSSSQIATSSQAIVEIDGSKGEGGGQVVRISMALAALLKQPIRIHSIRAGRKTAGLRNQHLCTVKLTNAISHGRVEGAQLDSTEFSFFPHRLAAGGDRYEADSKTGGSISLMVQGSLPCLLFGSKPSTLALKGGTHVDFSPSIDFIRTSMKHLLAKFGIQFEVNVLKCGFLPRGDGSVEVKVLPLASRVLQAIDVSVFSREIERVEAMVTVSGGNVTKSEQEALGSQVLESLKSELQANGFVPKQPDQMTLEMTVEDSVISDGQAQGGVLDASGGAGRGRGKKKHNNTRNSKPNVSLHAMLLTTTGGILSSTRTSVKETPYEVTSKVIQDLKKHIKWGVCADDHVADNAIVYMALAAGTSRMRITRPQLQRSDHLMTALELVTRLTTASYEFEQVEQGNNTSVVLRVNGMGLTVHE